MRNRINEFWQWFIGFANHLGSSPSDAQLNELLDQIQRIDDRLYFQISSDTEANELVITAEGNVEAFPIVDELVGLAPSVVGWVAIALKPALGFDFTFENNGVRLNAGGLWFLPLESRSRPGILGIQLGVPNASAVFGAQTIDAAYTVLETGLGERKVAQEVQHVSVADLPSDPAANGYIELPELASYIDWWRSKRTTQE